MAATRRTPMRQRELNELLTRDHTLNGAILFGLDGHVVQSSQSFAAVLYPLKLFSRDTNATRDSQ